MLRIEINECMFWIQTTATNKTRIPTTKPCQYKPTENNNRNHNNNSISCCSKPTPHPLRMLIFMSSLRLIMRERCNLIQFHAAAPERTMVGAGPTKNWKKSILVIHQTPRQNAVNIFLTARVVVILAICSYPNRLVIRTEAKTNIMDTHTKEERKKTHGSGKKCERRSN